MRRLAPVLCLVALWFSIGFASALAGESSVSFWLGFLVYVGLFVVSLTAALAASGSARAMGDLIQRGVVAGAAAVVSLTVGAFLPYAARLGGLEPDGFQFGDAPPLTSLFAGMLVFGLIGGAVGILCGILAWALRQAYRRGATHF